jgi:hypothetical protein
MCSCVISQSNHDFRTDTQIKKKLRWISVEFLRVRRKITSTPSYAYLRICLFSKVITALGQCIHPPFFHLFFSLPIYVFFAEKVNHRCLQLNLFCCCICVRPHSTMLGIHTYLSSDMAPRLEDPPSPSAPSPHLPP